MSWFNDEDKNKPWAERYKPYVTSRGIKVIPIYYRMVEDFDPDRKGKSWKESKLRQLKERKFQQQYEIDFGASEGGLVYPRFDVRVHVLLRPIPLQKDWIYRRAIDPGVAVTACLWYAITPADPSRDIPSWRFLIAEYYAGDAVPGMDAESAYAHAQGIKRKTQIICNAVFGDEDHNGESLIETTLMDASAWRREGSNIDLGSIVKSYNDAGIYPFKGTRDVEGSIELVKRMETPVPGRLHPEGRRSEDGRGFPVKFAYPGLQHYLYEKKHYHKKEGTDKPDKKAGKDHLMDVERILVAHDIDSPVIVHKQKESVVGKRLKTLKTPKHIRRDKWSRVMTNQ